MKKKQDLSSIEKKIAKDEANLAEDAQSLSVISEDIRKVVKILGSSGFSEFVRYLKSPWKIIWIRDMIFTFFILNRFTEDTLHLSPTITLFSP